MNLLILLTACPNNPPVAVNYCPPYIKPSQEFNDYVASGKYGPGMNDTLNRFNKQQLDILQNCYPEKYQEYLDNLKARKKLKTKLG